MCVLLVVRLCVSLRYYGPYLILLCGSVVTVVYVLS
jgi:hypothetical protein